MFTDEKKTIAMGATMYAVAAPFVVAGVVADKIKAAPTAIHNLRYDIAQKRLKRNSR